MSVEFYKQYFMQGNEQKYQVSLQNSESIPEKLMAIESLIYFHKYDQSISEISLIEGSNNKHIKQDLKISLLMLKALSLPKPSDKETALQITKQAEEIIFKIKNSTIPLNDEVIIFLFNKGKVLYNFQLLDEALETFKRCLKESVDNKFYQVRALNRIARIYYDQEKFDLASEHTMKSLANANKYHYEVFLAYEMLGLLNQTKNKDQSLKYFEYCLKIAMNDLQNDVLVAKSFMNIGKTKLLQNELDQSHHYLQESLSFYSKAAYLTYKPLVLKYLGDLFVRKGNYEEALQLYKQSVDSKQRQTINGMTLFAIGSTYFRIRDFRNALKYYNESLELKRSIGNEIDLAGSLWGIGHVYFIKQNYNQALKYYFELYEIYQKYGKPEYISEILLIIITLQVEKGDNLECQKYLDLMEKLAKENSSAHINLSFSIAQALSNNNNNLVSFSNRLSLLKKVTTELSRNKHFSYFSLLTIILIYLQEFIATQEDVVLEDYRKILLTLRTLASTNYAYPLELFSLVLLIQLNYLQESKEENNALLVKITSILDLIKIETIEKEVNKYLTKIDRLDKELAKSRKVYTKLDMIKKLGIEKFVNKIIFEKYWL